jgi:hypothetical protein
MTMHHHQQLLLMLPRSARPSMAAWRVRRPCQLHSARHGVCAGQAGGQGLTLACQRLASLHANGQRRRPAPTASADGQRRRPAPTASADPAAGGGGWLGGLTGAPPLLDHWNAAATAAAASAAAALSVMASRRRAAALRAGAGVRGWALPLERRAAGLPPQRGARPGEQTRRPAQLTKTLALSTDKRRPAPTASFVWAALRAHHPHDPLPAAAGLPGGASAHPRRVRARDQHHHPHARRLRRHPLRL